MTRLRDYRILDVASETPFDRIARLAALILESPMAVVTLVDETRSWFAGRHGVDLTSVPRANSWADAVLASDGPLVIPDTTLDERSSCSEIVTGAPFVRFHVGVPLVTADGLRVGTLCVFDLKPRPAPAAGRIAPLIELAQLAVDELELRRAREPVAAVAAVAGKARSSPSTQPTPFAPADGRPTPAHRSLYAAYVAKSEFLSSLSHELRTPLNAITGYAGLIAGADDTPPQAANHAGEVMAAARHMLSLVNDILEYSRIEAGQLSVGWQRVRLRVPVDEALRMVAVFAASRGVTLVPDLVWPEAMVRGDPVRLKQVLLNLLTNAIKFTPRGGSVTLSLTHSDDRRANITVRDTGIGIAEEDIAKALTPFGQIIAGDSGHLEGTGLGLPIAKALIERQGGFLTLHSALGEGTTVHVHLPALNSPSEASPARATQAPEAVVSGD